MNPMALLAALLCVETLALIVLGGVVHSTGSSLACPDWPTCEGTLFPELVGGVAFEHSHRMLAWWVSLTTLLLVVCLFRWRRSSPALRKLGVVLLTLLATQIALGAVTVLYLLPPAVSSAHLGTAMLFFVTSLWIAHLVARPARLATTSRTTRAWSSLAVLATFFQIFLGAVVRHSGAALACREFPLCGPGLWPDLTQPLQQLQMLHRVGALAVLVIVFGLFARLQFEAGTRRSELSLASLAALLVAALPLLGVWSLITSLGLLAVTLHLGVAAALLGVLVLLRLELGGWRPDLTRARVALFPARSPERA